MRRRQIDWRTGQRCWSRFRTIIAVFQTVWNLNYHSLTIRSVAAEAAVAEASATIGEGVIKGKDSEKE